MVCKPSGGALGWGGRVTGSKFFIAILTSRLTVALMVLMQRGCETAALGAVSQMPSRKPLKGEGGHFGI